MAVQTAAEAATTLVAEPASLLQQLTEGIDEAEMAQTGRMTLPQIAVLVGGTRAAEVLQAIIDCNNTDGGEEAKCPSDAFDAVSAGMQEFHRRREECNYGRSAERLPLRRLPCEGKKTAQGVREQADKLHLQLKLVIALPQLTRAERARIEELYEKYAKGRYDKWSNNILKCFAKGQFREYLHRALVLALKQGLFSKKEVLSAIQFPRHSVAQWSASSGGVWWGDEAQAISGWRDIIKLFDYIEAANLDEKKEEYETIEDYENTKYQELVSFLLERMFRKDLQHLHELMNNRIPATIAAVAEQDSYRKQPSRNLFRDKPDQLKLPLDKVVENLDEANKQALQAFHQACQETAQLAGRLAQAMQKLCQDWGKRTEFPAHVIQIIRNLRELQAFLLYDILEAEFDGSCEEDIFVTAWGSEAIDEVGKAMKKNAKFLDRFALTWEDYSYAL